MAPKLGSALLVLALAGCPAERHPRAPEADTPPRLVVLVVVDQLPSWAFQQKRPHLTRGFDRLLREGEWHTGKHPSVATLTAPGHALISTGEPPASSGILGNEWWHRAHERVLRSTEGADGSTSAGWLRVPALGDAVAAAKAGGKAVSVGLKDRAAILMLGNAGLPIWYDRKAAGFTSNAVPPWLADHNAQRPVRSRLDEPWTPLDAARLAALSQNTDAAAGEVGTKGFGAAFPHAPRATPMPADAIYAMPLGNELVFEVALAAIDGEVLGQDAVPDLLGLGLSAHDYVGHGWGQESWEAWDMMLRLDQQLGAFMAALDAKIGAGRWSLVLTSDHGGSPLPERIGGGRVAYETILDAANRAAAVALGPGEWVVSARYPTVFLSASARTKPPKEIANALTKIVYALRAFPGLARVELSADYTGGCEHRFGEAAAMCLAIDAERSGEVVYLPKHGWILHERDEPLATAHGSQHAYDREVPVIVLAPGRSSPHAPHATPSAPPLDMRRIAPLIAGWLRVPAPSELARSPR